MNRKSPTLDSYVFRMDESLFHQACQLDMTDRERFLRTHCSSSSQRQRVEKLLAADALSHGLLDKRISGTGALADRGELQVGDCIGDYELVQRIGEGGMGIVFKARQTKPVRRYVAIKMLRQGMDSQYNIARFLAERQALAMFEHPNLTRIIDGGTLPDGRPLIVMELVQGETITRYCDANQVGPRQRLEIFTSVCSAIHHAHQKGVIHRDIKPSNIMIMWDEDKAIPKVIDFGIAKALDQSLTEHTSITRVGDLLGTPEYMSPEQAESGGMDVDTRTDIFSAGAVLYELLTGSPPFSNRTEACQGWLETLEVIRERRSECPSSRVGRGSEKERRQIANERKTDPESLCRFLKKDLDWILLKALSRDRNERYETADAFRQDLVNYLDGNPVMAAAPTLTYRANKFFARHRLACLGFVFSIVLLVAATIFSTLQAVRATQAQRSNSQLMKQLGSESKKLFEARQRAKAGDAILENRFRSQKNRMAHVRAMQKMVTGQPDFLHPPNMPEQAMVAFDDRSFVGIEVPEQFIPPPDWIGPGPPIGLPASLFVPPGIGHELMPVFGYLANISPTLRVLEFVIGGFFSSWFGPRPGEPEWFPPGLNSDDSNLVISQPVLPWNPPFDVMSAEMGAPPLRLMLLESLQQMALAESDAHQTGFGFNTGPPGFNQQLPAIDMFQMFVGPAVFGGPVPTPESQAKAAIAAYQVLLSEQRKVLEAPDAFLSQTLETIATLHHTLNEHEKAEFCLRESITMRIQINDIPSLLTTKLLLVDCLNRQGRRKMARRQMAQCRQLLKTRIGKEHPRRHELELRFKMAGG